MSEKSKEDMKQNTRFFFKIGDMDKWSYRADVFERKKDEIEQLVREGLGDDKKLKLYNEMIELCDSCWYHSYRKKQKTNSYIVYTEYEKAYFELLIKDNMSFSEKYDAEKAKDGFFAYFLYRVSLEVRKVFSKENKKKMEQLDKEESKEQRDEKGVEISSSDDIEHKVLMKTTLIELFSHMCNLQKGIINDEEASVSGKIRENNRRRYHVAFLTGEFVHAIRSYLEIEKERHRRQCYSGMDHGLLSFTYEEEPESLEEVRDNPLKRNGDLGVAEEALKAERLRTPFIEAVFAKYFSISIVAVSKQLKSYRNEVKRIFG